MEGAEALLEISTTAEGRRGQVKALGRGGVNSSLPLRTGIHMPKKEAMVVEEVGLCVEEGSRDYAQT